MWRGLERGMLMSLLAEPIERREIANVRNNPEKIVLNQIDIYRRVV